VRERRLRKLRLSCVYAKLCAWGMGEKEGVCGVGGKRDSERGVCVRESEREDKIESAQEQERERERGGKAEAAAAEVCCFEVA